MLIQLPHKPPLALGSSVPPPATTGHRPVTAAPLGNAVPGGLKKMPCLQRPRPEPDLHLNTGDDHRLAEWPGLGGKKAQPRERKKCPSWGFLILVSTKKFTVSTSNTTRNRKIHTYKVRPIQKLTLIQHPLIPPLTQNIAISPPTCHNSRSPQFWSCAWNRLAPQNVTAPHASKASAFITGSRRRLFATCAAPAPSSRRLVRSSKTRSRIRSGDPNRPVAPAKRNRRDSTACSSLAAGYPQNQPAQPPPKQAMLNRQITIPRLDRSTPTGIATHTGKAAPPQTHTHTLYKHDLRMQEYHTGYG